jgi:kojibiose phosphorylase
MASLNPSHTGVPDDLRRLPVRGASPRADLSSALERAFRIVVLDWDGTAVADRQEDASVIRAAFERLLRAGVPVVVVTGTNAPNVERQLSAGMCGPHKQNLYLSTNRGSEVFAFDADGRPLLSWRRQATAEEDRRLTEVAEAVSAAIHDRTGLAIEVVLDRLNRRKIDLIPVPEWRDPPKSKLPALLHAVQARLVGGGLTGGLREAFEITERLAREHGLTGARVSSDVKHIEVGLTDKADAMKWVLRELVGPRGIRPEEMLVAGDEFGPVGGFPGSDDRMVVPEARGAVVVSVGPEPGGVPPPVIHLGGGPERFRRLVAAQAELYPVELPAQATADQAWVLVEEGFVPAREHEIESIFALGNGYVGCRGSLAETSASSAPATFVAGVFDDAPAGSDAQPALLVVPDWANVGLAIEGHPLTLDQGTIVEHRRRLDLRRGILWREWEHRDVAGRITRVRGLRLASQADRHLLVQSTTLTPVNYAGGIVVEGLLTAPVTLRTGRGVTVDVACASLIESPGSFARVASDHGGERVSLRVEIGRTYRIDRVLAVGASRDALVEGDGREASGERLEGALARDGVEGLVSAHRGRWEDLWRDADLSVEGDAEAQRALRFAAYHLLSAANPHDERVSIGARALTGRAYLGHVFWDTEIFMLPFFTLTLPDAARALLLYRHHTLPAARRRAAALGFRGALYAWESADTGDDVTPPWVVMPNGERADVAAKAEEQHISADVAYAIWSYWRASADDAFMMRAGAEILIETARFWRSRAELGEDGRFHVRGVVGPDEYHDSVDDDAYTNVMAQWNLERGEEIARLAAERWPDAWRALAERLDVEEDEPRRWREVAERMYTGLDPSTGVFEQFRGYFGLERIDLGAYAQRTAPMDVLLGPERIRRSQVIKQADVVMLLHLLWDRFPRAVREASFRFYEPRTDHGSSLSPPVHAAVAARLGLTDLAMRYFRQTADIDLANDMGNSAGGVHVGALGGLWQAAVFGFAGLDLTADPPVLRPRLPPKWRRVAFSVRWRGRRLDFAVPGEDAATAPKDGVS